MLRHLGAAFAAENKTHGRCRLIRRAAAYTRGPDGETEGAAMDNALEAWRVTPASPLQNQQASIEAREVKYRQAHPESGGHLSR